MPKIKTHSGAKKRFKLTKNGKVKRGHAFRSHLLCASNISCSFSCVISIFSSFPIFVPLTASC